MDRGLPALSEVWWLSRRRVGGYCPRVFFFLRFRQAEPAAAQRRLLEAAIVIRGVRHGSVRGSMSAILLAGG